MSSKRSTAPAFALRCWRSNSRCCFFNSSYCFCSPRSFPQTPSKISIARLRISALSGSKACLNGLRSSWVASATFLYRSARSCSKSALRALSRSLDTFLFKRSATPCSVSSIRCNPNSFFSRTWGLTSSGVISASLLLSFA